MPTNIAVFLLSDELLRIQEETDLDFVNGPWEDTKFSRCAEELKIHGAASR